MIDALDDAQGIQAQRLTTEQRQEKLFKKLEMSGLGSWQIPLHYSLEPCELGCTHSTKHVIKVTDDAPFKEWFRWIALPLVEEVCVHLWEMLDSGAIGPSQSAWCNTVVLVQEKDGCLSFCIDFHHLNACTKKDSYPLPRIQEARKAWSVLAIFHAWTWSPDSGRTSWMSCWSSTPCLLVATWASLSATTCHSDCAMHQQHFRG